MGYFWHFPTSADLTLKHTSRVQKNATLVRIFQKQTCFLAEHTIKFLPAAGLCVWQTGLKEAVEAVRKAIADWIEGFSGDWRSLLVWSRRLARPEDFRRRGSRAADKGGFPLLSRSRLKSCRVCRYVMIRFICGSSRSESLLRGSDLQYDTSDIILRPGCTLPSRAGALLGVERSRNKQIRMYSIVHISCHHLPGSLELFQARGQFWPIYLNETLYREISECTVSEKSNAEDLPRRAVRCQSNAQV